MEYGSLHLKINELLAEKGISKNQICKDLDIPRSNFNRYCRDEFQRLDVGLICKLCCYFHVTIGDLIIYIPPSANPRTDSQPVSEYDLHDSTYYHYF